MVELIVAMSVFSIAISLATGAFARALRTQRMLNHLMAVNSNASLAIEQMAREIRTGYDFTFSFNPGSDCNDILSFTRSRDSIPVSYKWNPEKKSLDFKEGERDFFPLTASNVLVKKFCLEETGTNPWRVTLYFTIGSINPQLAENVLNLQTTLSSRILPSDIAP